MRRWFRLSPPRCRFCRETVSLTAVLTSGFIERDFTLECPPCFEAAKRIVCALLRYGREVPPELTSVQWAMVKQYRSAQQFNLEKIHS